MTTRKQADSILSKMKTERSLIEPHWKLLADFLLPRRHRWLLSPNEQKGGRINSRIIDETASLAQRILTSGLQAGIASPGRPWFKLRIEGFGSDRSHPVQIWLSECERRMRIVMARSNFYNALATLYDDLGVFASGAFIILEDPKTVIRCHNSAVGEFFFQSSDRNTADMYGREFTQTLRQLIQWFGIDALPAKLKEAANDDNSDKLQEHVVYQLVEPNVEPYNPGVPRFFEYREMYWVKGSADDDGFLEERGFHEQPGPFARWDVKSGDHYGNDCPGMMALPAIKQLQQEQRRKAQGIDKMVNPPMVADIQLENKPASTIPGGVTYIAGLSAGNNVGFKPAYEVQNLRINELMIDIQEVQNRINRCFYTDLFMMFQQMEAEPRSATAIDARREEKMVMLGPVFERLGNEVLDICIDRIWGIMSRGGLFPPPPPEIAEREIDIAYISMLAQAQRAAETAAIERQLALGGNIAAVKPEFLDHYDFDLIPSIYNEALSGDPRVVRDPKVVVAERQRKAALAEAAAAAPAVKEGAQAAKLLSETPVGGGRSALQEMIS